MNLKNIFIISILSIAFAGYAQNISGQKKNYDYQMILLDSTYDSKIDHKLAKYVEKKRHRMEKRMQEVILKTDAELESHPFESPLSNFLTDILRTESPKYIKDTTFSKIDVSVLNFGGIRTTMPAGDVTVGDIYKISPFDNRLTFIVLKGRELRKMLGRFNDNLNAPYSGVTVTYRNGQPNEILLHGKELLDDKDYKLVTLDFISDGGDNIMSGIKFERLEYTTKTFRDFLIEEFKLILSSGRIVSATEDGRARKLR